MKLIFKIFLLISIIFVFSGCNLEKDIEIEIPEFENGYVVESYVAPGQKFGLLITKSYGFFEVFDLVKTSESLLQDVLVQNVEGYIMVNDIKYPLVNKISISLDSTRVYNYVVQDKLTFKVQDKVELYLKFPDGETVGASTWIPEFRPVDSVRLAFDMRQDFDARETSFVSSDSTTTEYFRRQLFRYYEEGTSELQDFVFDNSLATGGRLAFGSGFEFNVGDTLISRITHITEEYYRFFQSAVGSSNANTNPFTQPGRIESNIRGSDRVIGIFTGINPSEILMRVE